MNEGKNKVLLVRIGFGALLIAGLSGVFAADLLTGTNFATTLLTICAVGLGLWEFYGLAERKGLRPLKVSFTVAGCLLVVAQWFDCRHPGLQPLSLTQAAALGAMMLLFLSSLARRQRATALEDIAVTALGLCYVWFLASFGFMLRNDVSLPDDTGLWVTLMMVGASKSGDIGAFFTGRAIGRRRLAPAISPNKTVEGAIGGLAASIVFAVCFALVQPQCGAIFSVPYSLAFGLTMGVLSQAGDLFESLVKRSAHAKDSGSLIPEFGGFLDILDGVLFCCPAAFVLARIAS